MPYFTWTHPQMQYVFSVRDVYYSLCGGGKELSYSLIIDKNFESAVEYYTKAIEFNPSIAAYYGNRSFAYLKTEYYGYALTDATKALELDNKYIKVRNISYREISLYLQSPG